MIESTDLSMGSADHLKPFVLSLGLQKRSVNAVLNHGLSVVKTTVGAVLNVEVFS